VKLLLDTHIFVWWDRQLRRVPADLRAAIEDSANQVFVSAASVWEIGIKRATGKMQFAGQIVEVVERLAFELLPVTGVHAEHAGALPRHHNDPFDRMLIAQAYLERMTLATRDRVLRRYDVPIIGIS